MTPLIIILFLQHPKAQNWLTQQALSAVKEHINGEIHIDQVMVVFFNKVVVRGGYITGTQNDTLVSFKELSIGISSKNLLRGKIKVNRIRLSDGVFNLHIEDQGEGSNISRIFGSSEDESTGINLPPANITELRLVNFRFNFSNPFQEKLHNDKNCIDFSDISVSNINVKLNSISYKDKILKSHIENISCIEKSGWIIKNLSGDFSLGAKETRIDNLFLKDQFSNIRADYLSFKYNSGKDLSEFTDLIHMEADFRNAILDFRTLGKITPALNKNTLAIDISGIVKGPVVDINTKSLRVRSLSNETHLEVVASIKGLPEIDTTIFDINIKSLETVTPDVARLIASFTGTEPLQEIYSISPLTTLNYSCLANGRLDSLKIKGELNSIIGGLEHDIQIINSGTEKGVSIAGDITTQNLNIGNLLNNKLLGNVSLETNIESIFKGEEYGGAEFKINNLKIDRLGFNGYDYSNIMAVGEYSQDKFDGKVISHDPNLHFIFQGVFSLSRSKKNNIYNFHLDVPFADLAALNIDNRGEKSQFSLRTIANISNTLGTKDLFGMVDIKNLSFTNENGIYKIGNISLNSSFYEELFTINLDSPFISADYKSNQPPTEFLSKLNEILLYDQYADILQTDNIITDTLKNGNYEFNLQTYNTDAISKIILPGLYIADSTTLKLNILENNELDFNLTSDRIALNKFSIEDLNIKLSNPDSLLVCNINSSKISESSMLFENNDINITSESGKIYLRYLFANEGDIKNDLSFFSEIFFNRDRNNNLVTNIDINKSNLYIKGHEWTLSPSTLIIGEQNYELRNFKMYNQEQEISANGKISANPKDELHFNLNNFDISIINSFLEKDLEIKGYFTGQASLIDFFRSPGMVMDIKGTNVSLVENQIGNLNLQSQWDQENKRLNLLISNKYLDKDPINISGYYQPNSKLLSVDVALQDFSLTYIEPFLEEVLMDISGSLSGDMTLFGRLDMLNISTNNSRFEDFKFTPVFTKVPYTLNGPVEMTSSEISLINMDLTDKYNSSATINGSISHRFFNDIFLDAKLDFENLECLNLTYEDNQQFYGTAFASGNIKATGSIDDLLMDVDITTNEKTAIHVPLSSSSSATTNDLLSFVKKDSISTKDESYDIFKLALEETIPKESKIEIRGKANITPETDLFIEINKELGDILKCNGNGVINFDINPSKDIMDIRGDYTISEGNYNFVLLNGLTSKEFILNEGGNISFRGDILSTSLNIGATYQAKASVSTLIGDNSSVGSRRSVDCGIKLFGTLNNMLIDFSIDIPDLDPIRKGQVESALSTADKIQKQFMALILSGSFLPDEQSGIVNTTFLYSNASEIVSNQFNNIFRQLGIPVDLGLNYQPGTGGQEDMFDVALSFQILNNRVVINGNVGTGQNSSKAVMGNFEAEVKIDNKGKMRVKGFTKSADDYSNVTTQRSGIGFTYQDEFEDFKELWQSIFYSKSRKEEIATQKLIDAEAALKKEVAEIEATKQKINKAKESPYMRHY